MTRTNRIKNSFILIFLLSLSLLCGTCSAYKAKLSQASQWSPIYFETDSLEVVDTLLVYNMIRKAIQMYENDRPCNQIPIGLIDIFCAPKDSYFTLWIESGECFDNDPEDVILQ